MRSKLGVVFIPRLKPEFTSPTLFNDFGSETFLFLFFPPSISKSLNNGKNPVLKKIKTKHKAIFILDSFLQLSNLKSSFPDEETDA